MRSRLVIARRAFAMIVSDCLAHPATETGGILVGRKLGDDFAVPFVVGGGPKAIRRRTGFTPDSEWQQHQLQYLFDRFGFDYVGDYHRHPGHVELPSAIDLATAQEIVTSSEWSKPEAVFPITTIQDGTVRIRAFRLSRSDSDFVEIPVVVVPDSDRRVRRLLLTEPTLAKEVCRDVCASCGQQRGARSRSSFWTFSRVRSRPAR